MAHLERDEAVRAVVVTGTPPAFCVGGDSDALAGHAERGGYDAGLPAERGRPGLGGDRELDARLRLPLGLSHPDHRRGQRGVRRRRPRPGAVLRPALRAARRQADHRGAEARPPRGVRDELDPAPPGRRDPGRRPSCPGRIVTVAETESWGLWNGVAPDGEATLRWRRELRRRLVATPDPSAVGMTKRQIADDLLRHDRRPRSAIRCGCSTRPMGTAEYREGVAALREAPAAAVLNTARVPVDLHAMSDGVRGPVDCRDDEVEPVRPAGAMDPATSIAGLASIGAGAVHAAAAGIHAESHAWPACSCSRHRPARRRARSCSSRADGPPRWPVRRQRRRCRRVGRDPDPASRGSADSSRPRPAVRRHRLRRCSARSPPAPRSSRSPATARRRPVPGSACHRRRRRLHRRRHAGRRRPCPRHGGGDDGDRRPRPRRRDGGGHRRTTPLPPTATSTRRPTPPHDHDETASPAATTPPRPRPRHDRRPPPPTHATTRPAGRGDGRGLAAAVGPDPADRLLRRRRRDGRAAGTGRAAGRVDTLATSPQFADVATLAALGYRSIGDASTGYEHYINYGFIGDDKFLDPTAPESLVYRRRRRRTARSCRRCSSPSRPPIDDPTLVDYGGPLMQWHVHDNLCWAARRRRHPRSSASPTPRQLPARLRQRRRRQPDGPRLDRPPRVRPVRRPRGPRRRPDRSRRRRPDRPVRTTAHGEHDGHGTATDGGTDAVRPDPADRPRRDARRHARAAGVRREPRRRHARRPARSGPTRPSPRRPASTRSATPAPATSTTSSGTGSTTTSGSTPTRPRASSTSRSPTGPSSSSRRCTCCPDTMPLDRGARLRRRR